MGGECVNYSVTGKVAHQNGNELAASAPRNVYVASDHQHIALSCSSQGTWENLAHTIGRSDLIDDPRFLTNADRIKPENRMVLNKVIASWISDRPTEEVLSIFDEHGVTAGPVLAFDEISRNEHYLARESVKTIEDPVTGQGAQMPNVPFRMSESPTKVRFPGLPIGAGNEVVFKEVLNYDDDKCDALMNPK
jgi:crotonobetainyl-CoA:carnitine CoA-transferase CaiB-like acyl-CoA transferase